MGIFSHNAIRDGWLHTGDVARKDDEGYFYFVDRAKDLIKYKGHSVYPREIEDVLYEHPAVKLCAVVGVPDEVSGEIPKAFIVLRDDIEVSEESVPWQTALRSKTGGVCPKIMNTINKTYIVLIIII